MLEAANDNDVDAFLAIFTDKGTAAATSASDSTMIASRE
jgi:hypothetical protein